MYIQGVPLTLFISIISDNKKLPYNNTVVIISLRVEAKGDLNISFNFLTVCQFFMIKLNRMMNFEKH